MRKRTTRLLDVAGAAGGLLFFLPAMIVVAIAILLEDGFPRLRDYAKRTGLAVHTRNTITNLAQLERELERIQSQGWATDSEEAEIGVRCVAAGIRDDAGRLVAALSLSTPADRMKAHWGPLVKETADRISSTIGHRPTERIGAA